MNLIDRINRIEQLEAELKREREKNQWIIDKIFDKFSYCGHCGSYDCGDKGYRKLPSHLDTDKLLKLLEDSKKIEEFHEDKPIPIETKKKMKFKLKEI